MRRKAWFVVAVTVQVAALLIMIGIKWSTLAYGTKIILKTVPVDPWDVFRGDYITLNYEVSTLDLKRVNSGNEKFKPNDTVYITLVPDGKYRAAAAVSHRRPESGKLFMKGVINYYDEFSNNININYGIDSFYVPQHQGKDIENNGRISLEAEVSVDSRGNSALSKLFVDGKEIKFE